MAKKRVGVVLSGCGFLDGAEIHESVLTLLALDRAGVEVRVLAPETPQSDVIDHRASKPTTERRNVLIEAARISRGAIENVARVRADDFDAIILPGGYGAAKNLSTFATAGKAMKVDPDVEHLLRDAHAAKKPLGFWCIAPVIAARLFGELHPRLTIGNDPDTAKAVEAMGAVHVVCKVDDIVVDEKNKLVTTPAYMLGPTIAPVAAGIERGVARVLALLG
jgi:enhancing lycopene biosynthesis protein 2